MNNGESVIAHRFRAAVAIREPDQVPVSLAVPDKLIQEWSGIPEREYYTGRERRLEAVTGFYLKRFPHVVPTIMPQKRYESPTGPVKRLSLDEIRKYSQDPAAYLKEVLPRMEEEIIWYIDRVDGEIVKKFRGLIWQVTAAGPLGALADKVGWDELFRLLKEDPEFVRYMCEMHTQKMVAQVKAVEKVYKDRGITPERFFMVDEAIPMISPADLREFFLPYAQRICQASSSPVKSFHCDNDVVPIPEIMIEMGINLFLGNFTDYRVLKKTIGHKVALCGNISSLRILAEGTPEKVEEECRRAIFDLAPGGGYILSSGAGIANDTPMENLDMVVKAVEKYGTYPVSAQNSNVRSGYFVSPGIAGRFSEKSHGRDREESAADGLLHSLAVDVSLGIVEAIERMVTEAFDAGIEPVKIMRDGLGRGVHMATLKYYERMLFIPEMLAAGKAWQTGMDLIYSRLNEEAWSGTIVIGVVMGNQHETGIHLIKTMLRGAGYKVHNLGVSIPARQFVEKASALQADIIAIGVYTRERLPVIAEVVKLIREKGMPVKTLVGGIAVTEEIARALGVDACAENGLEAIEQADKLMAALSCPGTGGVNKET